MIEQVHEILNALKRPATLEDIAGRAQCSMEDAANALQSLMQDGYCVETKGKGNRKFAPIRMMHLIRCRTAAIPGAPAFARPLDGGSDLYLDMPDEIALDGDLILVRPTEGERPARHADSRCEARPSARDRKRVYRAVRALQTAPRPAA